MIAVAVAVAIAVALVAASLLMRDGGDDAAPAGTTSGETTTSDSANPALVTVAGIPQDGTVLGNPKATVTLLQFEDIQCPICKKYTDDAFPAIVNEYVRPGLVKIDFRGLWYWWSSVTASIGVRYLR